MKNIIFKSITIAIIISILTAIISFLSQSVEIGEGQIFILQLTTIAFEALIFFFPIFIGCTYYGLWETKERKNETT